MPEDLKIVCELKKTERFESFEVEYQGEKAFAKHAKSPNTVVHLDYQAKNCEAVNAIGGKILRAPGVIAKLDDWLITEWIEGQPLESGVAIQPEETARVVARVVNIFDSQPDSNTPLRPIFTPEGLHDRINERIAPAIKQEAGSLLEDSLSLFSNYSTSLKACLQDADVQPEHLFRDPTGKAEYILIDSEHLNTHWPRFYDLANNYSKYWKRDNREFARLILREYLEISNLPPTEIFESLVACLIVRALALHWENDYDPGALDTNVPRSQELLKLILKAKSLDDLL